MIWFMRANDSPLALSVIGVKGSFSSVRDLRLPVNTPESRLFGLPFSPSAPADRELGDGSAPSCPSVSPALFGGSVAEPVGRPPSSSDTTPFLGAPVSAGAALPLAASLAVVVVPAPVLSSAARLDGPREGRLPSATLSVFRTSLTLTVPLSSAPSSLAFWAFWAFGPDGRVATSIEKRSSISSGRASLLRASTTPSRPSCSRNLCRSSTRKVQS
mmetsp:Transcript_4507/g.12065  ORF Transcript_4507/g.12065 Transcript_4507/m.12065 type:complete len:215 (-) Transcript_4507:1915-2559(-)